MYTSSFTVLTHTGASRSTPLVITRAQPSALLRRSRGREIIRGVDFSVCVRLCASMLVVYIIYIDS